MKISITSQSYLLYGENTTFTLDSFEIYNTCLVAISLILYRSPSQPTSIFLLRDLSSGPVIFLSLNPRSHFGVSWVPLFLILCVGEIIQHSRFYGWPVSRSSLQLTEMTVCFLRPSVCYARVCCGSRCCCSG